LLGTVEWLHHENQQRSGQVSNQNAALTAVNRRPATMAMPTTTSGRVPARESVAAQHRAGEFVMKNVVLILAGIVDAVVIAEPSTALIELVIEGEVVDTFRAGGPPPAVRAVRAVPAGPGELRLAADVSEPPADGQTFAVQISTDHGQTWQTLGVGLKEPSIAVDRSQFTPGQEFLVRMIATNGLTSSVVTSEMLRA
jgi:hypothetical protein